LPSERFTKAQHNLLIELIIQCELQRFNQEESIRFVSSKLNRTISLPYLNKLKKKVRTESSKRLFNYMKSKDAFIYQFFQRIDECNFRKRELIRLYYLNRDNPILQKALLREDREESILLGNYYELVPALGLVKFNPNYLEDMKKDLENSEIYNTKEEEGILL
jgi:hypothetical protein